MRRGRLVVTVCVALSFVSVLATAAAGDSPPPPAAMASEPWRLPAVPTRCTADQALSVDLADCLLDAGGDPGARGWAVPPFPVAPGTPAPPELSTGWTWLGWAYDGSAALATWEQGLASNATAVGPIGPGKLRLQPDALPLFEGFIRELSAAGYKISQYGGYSFRCTSTTRKDCAGLDMSALSLHAFGLAVDIDPSKNPEITYVSSTDANGVVTSACAKPMTTSLPQWVIRLAQRWGLYWGGYGSYRRCDTPASMASSVHRDPMHFEFRGTVEQARAIAQHNVSTSAEWLAPPTTTATTVAAPPAAPASSALYILSRGSTGSLVTALQKALRTNKISVAVDGKFGPATEKALKTFQQRKKLPATGKVDNATALALKLPGTYAKK
jgi:hypothetical protein